ncbi:MAG TPA: hypothetical protein VJ825_11630 [Gemmatimonadaceae bacterium]|nr:hypothetical protein [Gemmatimonadaceae bacterium]
MPTEYDSRVIQEQADLLYEEADRALIVAAIFAGLIGLFIGVAAFYVLADRTETIAIVVVLGVPLAFAAIGLLFGQRRAFTLRSQAQQLLILVAIEMNTRRPAAAPMASAPVSAPIAAVAGVTAAAGA